MNLYAVNVGCQHLFFCIIIFYLKLKLLQLPNYYRYTLMWCFCLLAFIGLDRHYNKGTYDIKVPFLVGTSLKVGFEYGKYLIEQFKLVGVKAIFAARVVNLLFCFVFAMKCLPLIGSVNQGKFVLKPSSEDKESI